MDLQPGATLHGFTVTRVRPVPGTSAQLVEMLYERTRTELVWYKTDESNKLFSVIFKTLPRDSTGVFHILEHSLLCGSAKYPVKEPFVELLKSTMNTFLNAITFPDKTMYPVGSRNEQDFLNLTEVYLDAAFAPRALVDEKIFRQEGWHHEIEGDTLSYNGVVFNEMKGAMSSVDEVVYEELQEMLFPDTCYGFNSGGDPRVIPQLTYEHFCRSYREHYHPSNARIYLDGSIPLEKTLGLIDEYLSKFDLSKRRQETYQVPKADRRTVRFEIGPEEDATDKHQLVLGKILGTWQQKDRILAAQALCQVLCGANSSPLKRAILDEGLAQDVTMEVLDGIAQPIFFLRANNLKKENAPRIREVISSTAARLIQDGLDKDQLTAAINHLAFQSRDVSDPQALYRCIYALNAWLYEGDPMTYLTCDESVEHLRSMAREDGFERLLKELLLDEEGLCVLNAEPDPDYGAVCREEEQHRLARDYAAMSQEALSALAAENDRFHTWQQTPDTPEGLATLPVLSPDQVSPEPQVILPRAEKIGGVTVLHHEMETNGIVHLNAYFDLTDRGYDDLSAIRFLCGLLGKLPTENYDAAALDNQVKTWLGRLRFSVEVFGNEADKNLCRPCLTARCSVLKENLPRAKELLREILLTTKLDNPGAIAEILRQNIAESLPMIIGGGHSFAASCAMAHFSARNAAVEAVEGYTWVSWMKGTESDFENRREALQALLRSVLAENICTSRMTLSIAGAGADALDDFIASFPQGAAAPAGACYETKLPRKLGIRIPAQVSYACTGYRLDQCGETYRGTAQLAANILSLSCLWNSVRVQGGAYGAGMNCDRTGSVYCYSYRDPSPARSLGVYRELEAFLRAFPDSGESLVKYIISTIASTEPLAKPDRTAAEADRLFLCGIDHDALLRERRQLLDADMDALTAWCPMLEAMAKDAAVCVLGHDAALRDCREENLTIYTL